MLRRPSRREFLVLSVQSGVTALLAVPPIIGQTLDPVDERLLDDLSRRCFAYFWEQSDPHSGIAGDRARADATLHPSEGRYVGSTGATGFALSALCIGSERKWIPRHEARRRVEATLRSYATGPVANIHGWFYHFLDVRSGARYRTSGSSLSNY